MKKKKEKKFSLDKEIKSLIKSYRKKWNAMGERK
jgi:hypothetical protein